MLATLPRMLLACGMLLLLLCSTGAPGDGHSCSSALSFPLAVITLLCAPATSLLSALVPNGPIMQVQAVISGQRQHANERARSGSTDAEPAIPPRKLAERKSQPPAGTDSTTALRLRDH